MSAPHLRLAWSNPHPEPATPRSDLISLRLLGDVLAGSVRAGYAEGARRLAEFHGLSPLASRVVARQMEDYGLTQEEIRRVV